MSSEIYSEVSPDVTKQLREMMFPQILYSLLKTGDLDRERLDDYEYVWSIIDSHLDSMITNEMKVIVHLEGGFLEFARHAFVANKPEVAIVLVATAIEHTVNAFFRDLLDLQQIPEYLIVEILKNNNIRDKLGWLLFLLTRQEIRQGLRNRILHLFDVRNAIVHMKFRSRELGTIKSGELRYPISDVRDMDIDEVVSLVSDVEQELNNIHKAIDPDLRLAEDISCAVNQWLDNREKAG